MPLAINLVRLVPDCQTHLLLPRCIQHATWKDRDSTPMQQDESLTEEAHDLRRLIRLQRRGHDNAA